MTNIFQNIAGDVVESLVKGAITRFAKGLVAKGQLTPAEEETFVAGAMLEVRVALQDYATLQAKSPPQ